MSQTAGVEGTCQPHLHTNHNLFEIKMAIIETFIEIKTAKDNPLWDHTYLQAWTKILRTLT